MDCCKAVSMSVINDIISLLGYTPTQIELARYLVRRGIRYNNAKAILWQLSKMRNEKINREAVLIVWPDEGTGKKG